jgi:AraC-like DNA-binding protein
MEYVEMLRIERACQLLRAPYARVGEVADDCGYTDLNYFARVFKRRMGLPPARWRREYGLVAEGPGNQGGAETGTKETRRPVTRPFARHTASPTRRPV